MTNKVSYIIQFKDKFSRTADNVNRKLKKIDERATASGRKIGWLATEYKMLAATAKISLSKISASIRKVSFDSIGRSADMAKARIKGMQQQAKKTGKVGLGAGTVASAAVTLPTILIGKSLVDASSDATENANKFNTVFESIKTGANSVADSFAESYGVAASTSRELIGSTGDLLVGLGITEKGALKMSKSVVELAADLASFQNLEGGAADAADRLTKGLTGETESLKAMGIIIRQDTKAFKDLVKFTMRSERITLQAAKAKVILAEAAKQSGKALGDVRRTWGDYANAARRATEKNIALKETYGKHLIPLAEKLIEIYEELADWLISLSPATQRFALALAGVVAIGGPLLLIASGLIFAFGLMSATMVIVSASIAGLAVAGALLIANWGVVTQFFKDSMNILAASTIVAVVGIILMWRKFKGWVLEIFDEIGNSFTALWEGRFIDSIKSAVNVGVKLLNGLLLPVSAISNAIGFGQLKIPEFETGGPALTAPVGAGNGTVNGQITVAAAPGSEVKSTKLTNKSSGLNLGLNMRAL